MKLFLILIALLGFTLHNALLFALMNKWVQSKVNANKKLQDTLGCFSLLTIFPPLFCTLVLVFSMPFYYSLAVFVLFACAIIGVYRENKKLSLPTYFIRLKNGITIAVFVMLFYALGQIMGWWM